MRPKDIFITLGLFIILQIFSVIFADKTLWLISLVIAVYCIVSCLFYLTKWVIYHFKPDNNHGKYIKKKIQLNDIVDFEHDNTIYTGQVIKLYNNICIVEFDDRKRFVFYNKIQNIKKGGSK